MITTTVGLLGDSIRAADINKLFPDRNKGASACHRGVVLSGTVSIRALGAGTVSPPPASASSRPGPWSKAAEIDGVIAEPIDGLWRI